MAIFDARHLDSETPQDLAWLAAILQPTQPSPRSTGRRDGVFLPRKPRGFSGPRAARHAETMRRVAGVNGNA